MILLVAVGVSLLIALLRGGKIDGLANYRFRFGWLALVALAIQVALVSFPLPQAEGRWGVHSLGLMGSYLLLILVIVFNRRLPGLPLLGLGLGLNLVVMLANGGYMPISPEAVDQAGFRHLLLSDEPGARLASTKDVLLPRDMTNLWILSDIFLVPSFLPLRSVFSIGDALLACGVFILFQQGTRRALTRVTTDPGVSRASTSDG
ncbi:MAG: DUF5317 domain-containing protein [Anaerolineae bacterium]